MDRQRNLIREKEDKPLRGGGRSSSTKSRKSLAPTQRQKKPTLTPAERRALGDARRAGRK